MGIKNDEKTINSKTQLIEYFESQCKLKSDFKIGTEHEKFLFYENSLMPLSYNGDIGISRILNKLSEKYDMIKILEDRNTIGLIDKNGGSISLEPGGQLELSGAPLKNIHQTCNETGQHLKQMHDIFNDIGAKIKMLGIGFHPFWKREDIFWMPKGRYKIMKKYMPKRGDLGIDMMLRSCTVQVNLDFENEKDMVRKFKISLALQPVATALFANSPFKEEKNTGFKSFRSHLWTDTDPDRCGIPECVFEENFGFERWVDYILDVPMYFLKRDGKYLDFTGKSFKKLLLQKDTDFKNINPSIKDFEDHLSTAFPEVRLKGYLEMRGADAGLWDNICALPAFWVGILYDNQSIQMAEDLIKNFKLDEIKLARLDVAKKGLNANYGKQEIIDVAKNAVNISYEGLKRRNINDSLGENETKYLLPLIMAVEKKKAPADLLVEKFENDWKKDIKKVIENNSM